MAIVADTWVYWTPCWNGREGAGLRTPFPDVSSLDLFGAHSLGLFSCFLWGARENMHCETLKKIIGIYLDLKTLYSIDRICWIWICWILVLFTCLSPPRVANNLRARIMSYSRSCRGCHWIKSWPHWHSYDTIRSDSIIPILKMKKRILNRTTTRCSESKSREALRAIGSGGTMPELESWLCCFLGNFGHIMKTSIPQCLQLQNEDNKVSPSYDGGTFL